MQHVVRFVHDERGQALTELVITLPLYMAVVMLVGAFAWWWWNQTVAATAITDGVRQEAMAYGVAGDERAGDGHSRASEILVAGLGRFAQPYRENLRIRRWPQLRSVWGSVWGQLTVPLVNWRLRVESSSFQRFEQFYPGPPEAWE